MKNRPIVDRISAWIVGLGSLFTVAVWLLFQAEMGLATAVGALIALGNWMVIRWIVKRVTHGSLRTQAALMLLLCAKMGALMGLIYLLISRHWVDPIGFLVGISALVCGLLLGTVNYLNNSQVLESE